VFGGGWTLIILILSLRILAGIFGMVGACRRKVRAVKRTSAEAAATPNQCVTVCTLQESILEFDLFHHFDRRFVILRSASKGHYYFLVVNLVLSVVIARPLWLCDCFCFEPSQDLVMCLGSRINDGRLELRFGGALGEGLQPEKGALHDQFLDVRNFSARPTDVPK